MPTARQPIIGITGRKDASARLSHTAMHSVGQTYTYAIHTVGGTPVIIPPVMSESDWQGLTGQMDGLLLSGGEDIAPQHYGQQTEAWMGGVDAERDASELGLIRAWLASGKPLMAICRGHQVLNVALGGTLYQDIGAYFPDALDHAYVPTRPMEELVHSVRLAEGSRLGRIVGALSLEVNSAHHQAVQTPGEGMVVVAYAPDGVVEATENPQHPFCVTVQWHPEAMVKINRTMWPLFEAFVRAARPVA